MNIKVFFKVSFLLLIARYYYNNYHDSSKKSKKSKKSFKDVLGVEEFIEELEELVDFFKNPQKYEEIGANLPKGVLLVGPPGVGKTLLAKALAGERNGNFKYISASLIEQKFVGSGASNIRKIFKEARE